MRLPVFFRNAFLCCSELEIDCFVHQMPIIFYPSVVFKSAEMSRCGFSSNLVVAWGCQDVKVLCYQNLGVFRWNLERLQASFHAAGGFHSCSQFSILWHLSLRGALVGVSQGVDKRQQQEAENLKFPEHAKILNGRISMSFTLKKIFSMKDRFDKCSAHNGHSELAQRFRIHMGRIRHISHWQLTERNYGVAERGLRGN